MLSTRKRVVLRVNLYLDGGGNKIPSFLPPSLLWCPALLNQTLERGGRLPGASQVAQTIADLQGFKFQREPLTNTAVAPFRWRGPRQWFITLSQDENKCCSLTRTLTASVTRAVSFWRPKSPAQTYLKARRQCSGLTSLGGNQSLNQSVTPSVPLLFAQGFKSKC